MRREKSVRRRLEPSLASSHISPEPATGARIKSQRKGESSVMEK